MKIAVCDDLKEALTETKELLERIPFIKQIDTFSDIDMFYSEIDGGVYYDVILMDIDWNKEETGIDFANRLLEKGLNTKIIYMTAYTIEYVEQAVLKSASLSGFLMKPIKEDLLLKTLNKVLRQMEDADGKLLITYKGVTSAVPFYEIYYLESHLRITNIKLRNREVSCMERLSQLKGRLGRQLLECHKSYIVNMDHIREIRGNEILLDDERCIPVSKKHYKEVKARFFEYMAERM